MSEPTLKYREKIGCLELLVVQEADKHHAVLTSGSMHIHTSAESLGGAIRAITDKYPMPVRNVQGRT